MGQPWAPQHWDPALVQFGGDLGCNDVTATIRLMIELLQDKIQAKISFFLFAPMIVYESVHKYVFFLMCPLLHLPPLFVLFVLAICVCPTCYQARFVRVFHVEFKASCHLFLNLFWLSFTMQLSLHL